MFIFFTYSPYRSLLCIIIRIICILIKRNIFSSHISSVSFIRICKCTCNWNGRGKDKTVWSLRRSHNNVHVVHVPTIHVEDAVTDTDETCRAYVVVENIALENTNNRSRNRNEKVREYVTNQYVIN